MLKRYTLLLAMAVVGACSETTSPPPVSRAPDLEVTIPARHGLGTGPRFMTLGTPDDQPTNQPWVTISPSLTFTPSAAILKAVVQFMGNSVNSVAHLNVYDSDGKAYGAPVDGYANASYLIPTTGTVYPVAQLAIGKPCGLVANGSVTAESITGPLGSTWASGKQTRYASAAQPACATGGGGSVSGTGTGDAGTGGGMWVQVCRWEETSYVDSTGSHTTDTFVCRMVYYA